MQIYSLLYVQCFHVIVLVYSANHTNNFFCLLGTNNERKKVYNLQIFGKPAWYNIIWIKRNYKETSQQN